LLYQLVERHYPEFKETLSEQGKQSPKFVEREFDEFLRCSRLEHGFCGSYVATVNMRSSWRLVASEEAFVPAVVLEEWPKVPHFW
jgi:hypothetical protein